jgi:3-deoxy-7-phosphoheptulonate synthase
MNKQGQTHPNYHYEDILLVSQLYAQQPELKNPAVIIDTNHSNSGKNPFEQVRIAKEIVHNRKLNSDVAKLVKGLMIESYIEDGNQPVGGGCYGKSITDACLGWDKSQRLIFDLAERL